MMRNLSIVLLLFLIGCKEKSSKKSEEIKGGSEETLNFKPIISFTFDDGSTNEIGGLEFKEWNRMILTHLDNNKVKAIFFVTGRNKTDELGQFLLRSWNDKGHKIANHTFSHPNFSSDKNNVELFENELNKTHDIISKFSNSIRLFRYPYLKEGSNKFKVDSIRNVLQNNSYKNGYVTIDASDWYINKRLIDRINTVGLENADTEKFKSFYIQHLIDRANYYEDLSYEINERHIRHTLLLHHNLSSALFLGDLIKEFEKKGWTVMDAENAYQDKVFSRQPNSEFAGESLIWSLAKESGKYEKSLRYPAEDSRYEKEKMDSLGL